MFLNKNSLPTSSSASPVNSIPVVWHTNHFTTTIFPVPTGWAGARRNLLDCMVLGRIR